MALTTNARWLKREFDQYADNISNTGNDRLTVRDWQKHFKPMPEDFHYGMPTTSQQQEDEIRAIYHAFRIDPQGPALVLLAILEPFMDPLYNDKHMEMITILEMSEYWLQQLCYCNDETIAARAKICFETLFDSLEGSECDNDDDNI